MGSTASTRPRRKTRSRTTSSRRRVASYAARDEAEVIEVAPCEDVVKNILNKRERELKVRRMFAAAAAAARVCVHFARKKRAKLRAAP